MACCATRREVSHGDDGALLGWGGWEVRSARRQSAWALCSPVHGTTMSSAPETNSSRQIGQVADPCARAGDYRCYDGERAPIAAMAHLLLKEGDLR